MGKNPKIKITTPQAKLIETRAADGTISVKFSWDKAYLKSLENRLQGAQTQLDLEVMKQMQPYMQLVTGTMISSMLTSTDPGSGIIVVNTPYARRVYYSKSGVGRPTGPLRGPYYFERMKADKLPYLLSFVKKKV